jgi:hypothetical protein
MPIIIFLLTLLSMPSLASDFPEGWRLPTERELSGDDSLAEYAQIESDFNDDGKLDQAYLLKSTAHPGEGLIVNVSTSQGNEWLVLDRVEWGEEYAGAGLKMRIKLAQPGSYTTACALGYWQCEPDEPAVLELKRAAIYQDRFDGAIATWFWHKETKQFKKIWLGNSDDR